MSGNTCIPAKPIPAYIRRGAGSQVYEIVTASNCLDGLLRGLTHYDKVAQRGEGNSPGEDLREMRGESPLIVGAMLFHFLRFQSLPNHSDSLSPVGKGIFG